MLNCTPIDMANLWDTAPFVEGTWENDDSMEGDDKEEEGGEGHGSIMDET